MRTKVTLLALLILGAWSCERVEAPRASVATVTITLDESGALSVDSDEVADPNAPVRFVVTSPQGSYTVDGDNMREAVAEIGKLSSAWYRELESMVENRPLITPEQLAAMAPEERADVEDKLSRIRDAMESIPSREDALKMTREERAEAIARARAILTRGADK